MQLFMLKMDLADSLMRPSPRFIVCITRSTKTLARFAMNMSRLVACLGVQCEGLLLPVLF